MFRAAKVVQEQPEPETLIGATAEQLRSFYCNDQKKHQHLNTVALRTADLERTTLRIMTYNVHMWISVDGRSFSTDGVLENIRVLNPDVLVLNETNCLYDGDVWDDDEFTTNDSRVEHLKAMGFVYSSAQKNTYAAPS